MGTERRGFNNGLESAQARFEMFISSPQGDDRAATRPPRREGIVPLDLGPELVIWRHRAPHLDTISPDVHEALSTGLTSLVVSLTVRPDEGRLLDGSETCVRRRVGGLFVSGHRRDRPPDRAAVLRDASAQACRGPDARRRRGVIYVTTLSL